MTTLKYLVMSWLMLATGGISARPVELHIRFLVESREQINYLTSKISIDDVRGDTVYAYLTEQEMADFEKLGYTYEILPHPVKIDAPKMAGSKSAIADWDSYPTYTAYVAMMYQYQTDYPDLCRIVDIGGSVENRRLLTARISDQVTTEEDEPEVFLTSSIHGNETTGYVLMLRLIDSLLTGYGVDSLTTRLIDSCEIWINPLANPDGTYAFSDDSVDYATRFNANGADLNRNFPDPEDGDHPDGREWQPEALAMISLASEQSFVLAANFHGGAELFNYPWDTWAHLHPDDLWFVTLALGYVDSAHFYSPSGYMTGQNNGITNGYAWYEVNGGRQDYMNYWAGCREVTIELSLIKLVSPALLPLYWNYNRSSFMNYIEQSLYGLRGIVTDAATGNPLAATVRLIGHDTELDSSRVFTDPDVGDYHRLLLPAYYDLEVSSPGYYTRTINTVAVFAETATRVDVALDRIPLYVCGDANDDLSVNVGDAVFVINYVFRGGPPPTEPEAADVNGDGDVNVGDAVFLINYAFKGGTTPICD